MDKQFEDLEDSIVKHIYDMYYSALMCGLRGTCKKYRDLLPAPEQAPDKVLYKAAKYNEAELCHKAKARGATGYNQMLYHAVKAGNINICRLAEQWCSQVVVPLHWHTEFDKHAYGNKYEWSQVLISAAAGGHEDMCALAVIYGSKCNIVHERCQILYKDLLTRAFIAAVQHGHVNVCELFIEWGKQCKPEIVFDFNLALFIAAKYGHEKMCKFAKHNGATEWDWMFAGAVDGCKPKLCTLSKEWGATRFDHLLYGANVTKKGSGNGLKQLAIEWGFAVLDRITIK
jgi:hypothetical protein